MGSRTVLFLDKVLLRRRAPLVRGVELFNLNLMRDLAALGLRVTVPVHTSWVPAIKENAPEADLELMPCSFGRGPLSTGIPALLRMRRRCFDVMLLANVGNGLIPLVQLTQRLQLTQRCVLVAHREPRPQFVRAQARIATSVVAVNEKIASHFRGAGFERVDVRYGVTDAESFVPASPGSTSDRVRFCVLGQLDNAWKGADTAMAAFRLLPEPLRFRCELHLASFSHPPPLTDGGVVAHRWMDASAIPPFLRTMDVMLVPSRDEGVMRETFSQAMVQGMLSGLPVIVSNLPVLVEKLDEGGGLVFDSVDALAGCMVKLAGAPDLRREMGSRSREVALKRYVWDTRRFVDGCLFPGKPARGAS